MVAKRITINDVAQAAGVHRSTVSRALTGSGPVSSENREKVLRAAKALNYYPDTLAGSLKSKRRNTWGLLSFWYYAPNSMDHYFSKSLGGMMDAANRVSYRLLMQNFVGRFDGNEDCIRFCNDSQLAGLAVLAPRTTEAGLVELKRLHVPVVLLLYRPEDPTLSFVDMDNIKGAEMITKHLIDKGHKRIGYVGGELELSANARDRYKGYKQALRAADLKEDPDLVSNINFDPNNAVAALQHYVSLPAARRPTAVFCATDAMARALVDEAKRRGMTLPQDLAVAGFDNSPAATSGTLGLTTVHYPFFEAAARAGDALVQLSKEGTGPVRELLEPSLVVREST